MAALIRQARNQPMSELIHSIGQSPDIACNVPSDALPTSAVAYTPTSAIPNNVLDTIPMDQNGCHGTDVLDGYEAAPRL
jgi:hypothetical protein